VNDPTTIRRLYGRRSGHKLRSGQAALLEELLPAIAVPETGPIDAARLFGDARPLHFEIGFGSGEHLAYRADLLPDHGFIGCEPFLNGVVGALQHVRDSHLANVRLHMGDALDVLERVPDASLRFVYLLHPDPWPKARHAKRRMVNPGPLDLIAAKLEPGGELRLGTDDPVYCRWAMMVMGRRRDFEWLAESASDFLTRPGGWPETRYEAKARRKGHEVWYFRYRRISS
jgi:tRNA (guanine-N7-)-methyltransferase